MGVKVGAFPPESMSQQDLGGEAGDGDDTFLEKLGALEERGLDGHVVKMRRVETRRQPGLAAPRTVCGWSCGQHAPRRNAAAARNGCPTKLKRLRLDPGNKP